MTKAFISGCSGYELLPEEKAFFRSEDPWGLILFRRNCGDPEQLATLVASFRAAVGRPDAPVLIDQEGGRVQRLRPPNWPSFPSAKRFGDLYGEDPQRARKAAFLGARLIAHELLALGITVDCLPLLDICYPDTVDAIGDRAYSDDPDIVADLGRATYDGLLDGGVLPVIKHLPGHGRALVDSHLELPRVRATRDELEEDYRPFRALVDAPLAMTAHLLYEAVDGDLPATQSARVIQDIIRKEIGFSGCLMSDDISMKALGGDMRERAAACFAAGCDIVLHCNAEMSEMKAVASATPELAGTASERCEAALALRADPPPGFDASAAQEEFARLMTS